MRRLITLLILLCAAVSAGGAPAGWKPIKNESFSFWLPPEFQKTNARGIDSFVEGYVAADIMLSFDYGEYSNNFGEWPKETLFEHLKIDGKVARVGVAKKSFREGYPYSTQVRIEVDDRVALSMFAACRSEKEVALAREIFLSIAFAAKASKRP